MKKIAVLFVLILAFCGCENSSEPGLEERFSCKVDGKLFVCKPDDNSLLGVRNLTIDYYNTGASPSYFLSVGASSPDTTNISFGCDSVIKLNTPYSIRSGGITFKGGEIFDPIIKGTLTLSKLGGGQIAGTFEFTAKERGGTKIATVTDGKFNVTYISR